LDSERLRQLIRERIATGALPGAPATLVWTGWGSGRRCSACDEPIKSTDAEIEIEAVGGRPNIRFHQQCFAVWRTECDHVD
jgi:hypothetical protein